MKHKKILHNRYLKVFLSLGILVFLCQAAFPQASPGPYEILPMEDAYIAEAWKDLIIDSSSTRADWTGFIGTFWESPNAYNNHEGSDFSLDTGTPLYAPADGTVVEVVNNVPENDHTMNYFGNYVKIEISSGVSPKGENIDVILAHQLPQVQVSVGENVVCGQLVGYSDNTGQSTSEHIHFESQIRGGGCGVCPFYHGHFKYPIMLNPTARVQVGHVIRIKSASAPIRSERFVTSAQISTAYQDQLYFSSYWKRGFYNVFIPNDSGNRIGWILATDAEEVFTGTVIQTLPDSGEYVHEATLANPYDIKASPDAGSATIGQIVYGGGRFVADQMQSGWYRIAIPGSASWGWVLPDNNMIVYPELYNPSIDLGQMPNKEFPLVNDFTTVEKCMFGRPKYNRSFTKSFSPASPGGDGIALLITDANTYGSGYEECVTVGKVDHRNYYVEADVYLDYKPDYFPNNEDQRYGIFARDDGFSSMDKTFEGKGNCYCLVFDSDKGYIHAGKFVDADLTDFLPSKIQVTTDGWNTFRIECEEDHIRYYMNEELLIDQIDTEFPCGPCGMGYVYHGSTYPSQRGGYFDNFIADVLSSPTPTPTPTATETVTPTPTPTPTQIPDIPAAPSDLVATGVSSSQIDLVWVDNSDNEDNFVIERSKSKKGTYEVIDTVPADTTIYNDAGLPSNSKFFYRVKATNAAGDSGYSNLADAKTLK